MLARLCGVAFLLCTVSKFGMEFRQNF